MENERKSKYYCQSCGKDVFLTRSERNAMNTILCSECSSELKKDASQEYVKLAQKARPIVEDVVKKGAGALKSHIDAKKEEQEEKKAVRVDQERRDTKYGKAYEYLDKKADKERQKEASKAKNKK